MTERVIHLFYKPVVWMLVLLFIIIYPMLISIYVFLPLLIGIMGYLFIRSVDELNFKYFIVSIFYFTNLEVNLSLPLFLTLLTSLLVYILFYKQLSYFRRCKICKPILTVILIDIGYFLMLLFYDYIFQTTSIVIDNILLYTLVIDILVVAML